MIEDSIYEKIGENLVVLIKNEAFVEQIANWADTIYSNYSRYLDNETEELITKISFMQHSPECLLDKNELENIVRRLISKKH